MKALLQRRIASAALAALFLVGMSSRLLASSSDMLLEIKDEKGKVTKVTIADDGSFTTPALAKGSYTFSWSIVSRPAGSNARNANSPGSADIAPAKVCLSYAMYGVMKGAREVQSGQASGKRQHKPITLRKSIDKSSPQLMTTFDPINVDEDCDGLEGKITFLSKDGKTMAVDDWSPRSN